MIPENFLPDIESIQAGYKNALFTPRELLTHLYEKASDFEDRNIWINRFSMDDMEPFIKCLEQRGGQGLADMPLYGVPFAVKDNIDVAGFLTTAGCQEFAYEPDKNSFVVEQLINAGAVPMGKTNLDQFATGLVGTRSPEPWGPCRNSINPDYISGGSSSGSSVAVALGLVTFSLGTDTAGSGRVPAMLNNIIGLKPSRGLFSMSGVVPACRSLDCPSVFALSVADAETVFSVAAKYDAQDAYSRPNPFANSSRYFGSCSKPPVIGVPMKEQLKFFGESDAERLYAKSLEIWQELGAKTVEIDFEPMFEAARLLYEGPWVAERYAAIEALMQNTPEVVHPVVRTIVQAAESKTAVDGFKAEYQMQGYRALVDKLLSEVEFLLTPTAPRAYLVDELLEDPIQLNSNMGYYTNYMNLLDLSGLAVPAGFMSNGMPFGVTLIGKKFEEEKLLSYASQWERKMDLTNGATGLKAVSEASLNPVDFSTEIQVAVCGAHLDGMPLNWQLRERAAVLKKQTRTSANYRFYVLGSEPPMRPGLLREEGSGISVEVEVWSIAASEFGSFVAAIPYPLGIGKVELQDGAWVSGFMCEADAVNNARDISEFGSWRNFMAQP